MTPFIKGMASIFAILGFSVGVGAMFYGAYHIDWRACLDALTCMAACANLLFVSNVE